jgi:hypothetical protein
VPAARASAKIVWAVVRVASAQAADVARAAAVAVAAPFRSLLEYLAGLLARWPSITRPLQPSYPAEIAHLIETYAADKGAPPDFALASVGAKVVASSPSAARLYMRYLTNCLLALAPTSSIAYAPSMPNSPSVSLNPDISPGNCWAFPGDKGSITVRLARPMRPDRITLEHTPKSSVFSVNSAPRRVDAYALPLVSQVEAPMAEFVKVGEFTYDISPMSHHMQTFALDASAVPDVVRTVRFDILSNHGSPTHTCLYRVRVHGKPFSLTEAESVTQRQVL